MAQCDRKTRMRWLLHDFSDLKPILRILRRKPGRTAKATQLLAARALWQLSRPGGGKTPEGSAAQPSNSPPFPSQGFSLSGRHDWAHNLKSEQNEPMAQNLLPVTLPSPEGVPRLRTRRWRFNSKLSARNLGWKRKDRGTHCAFTRVTACPRQKLLGVHEHFSNPCSFPPPWPPHKRGRTG